jgi:hypothetical protein
VHDPLRPSPERGKPGKREQRIVRRMQVPGMLGSGDRTPFVIAAGGHQAARAPEGIAKRPLLLQAFAARIRELVSDRRVLRPMRDEPPAIFTGDAGALLGGAYGENLVSRADVEARRESRRRGEAEAKRDDSGIGVKRVTTAHGPEVTISAA